MHVLVPGARLPVIYENRQRWLEMRDPVLRLAAIQGTPQQLAGTGGEGITGKAVTNVRQVQDAVLCSSTVF